MNLLMSRKLKSLQYVCAFSDIEEGRRLTGVEKRMQGIIKVF